jgi:hypothetical protein
MMAGRFTARRVAAPELAGVEEPASSALEGVAWTVFPEAPPEPAPPVQQPAAIRCSATSCSTPRCACTAS